VFELGRVFQSGYSPHTINRAWLRMSESVEAIASGESVDKGSAAVVIDALLRGQIAGTQQRIRNAADAVSMVQTFEAASCYIGGILTEMSGLAEKAASGLYIDEQLELMQDEFEELAEQINYVTTYLSYNGNKLLGGEGEDVTINLSSDSTMLIPAADLSFDISSADLTSDAVGALGSVRAATAKTITYCGTLAAKTEVLEKTIELYDFEIIHAMGFQTSISNTDLAREINAEVQGQIMAESVVSLAAQSSALNSHIVPPLLN